MRSCNELGMRERISKKKTEETPGKKGKGRRWNVRADYGRPSLPSCLQICPPTELPHFLFLLFIHCSKFQSWDKKKAVEILESRAERLLGGRQWLSSYGHLQACKWVSLFMLALIVDSDAAMEESPGLSRKGYRDQTWKLLVIGASWISVCHPWARARNKDPSFVSFFPPQILLFWEWFSQFFIFLLWI